MPVHRGRYPHWAGHWKGKQQADQPFPFMLHTAIRSVGKLRNILPTTSTDQPQWALYRVPPRQTRR